MLDPDLTDVLRRRIAAFCVDLALVVVGTLVVWWTQLRQFAITSRNMVTGEPIFDPVADAELREIAGSLHTKFERSDTWYVLDQGGIVLTALLFAVIMAMVFTLIPAITGWTPGLRAMRLVIVDETGTNPGVVPHVIRSATGVVDALPIVVPGLLGWLTVRGDEFHRRLGDRLAKTFVVDARMHIAHIDPELYARRRELRRATSAADDRIEGSDRTDDMVLIDDRLAPSASDARADTTPTETAPTETAPTETTPTETTPADTPPTDSTPTFEQGSGNDASRYASPAPNAGSGGDPLRFDAESGRAPAAGESSDDQAFTASAGAVGPVTWSEAMRAPKPTHRSTEASDSKPPSDDSWERPTSEPAPVWDPRRMANGANGSRLLASSTPEATLTETPAPAHRDRAPAASTVAGHTSDPTPQRSRTPSASEAPSATETPSSHDRSTTPPTEGPGGTIWNEEWQAWLFWDAGGRRWLRHDPDTDRWLPIGSTGFA